MINISLDILKDLINKPVIIYVLLFFILGILFCVIALFDISIEHDFLIINETKTISDLELLLLGITFISIGSILVFYTIFESVWSIIIILLIYILTIFVIQIMENNKPKEDLPIIIGFSSPTPKKRLTSSPTIIPENTPIAKKAIIVINVYIQKKTTEKIKFNDLELIVMNKTYKIREANENNTTGFVKIPIMQESNDDVEIIIRNKKNGEYLSSKYITFVELLLNPDVYMVIY